MDRDLDQRILPLRPRHGVDAPAGAWPGRPDWPGGSGTRTFGASSVELAFPSPASSGCRGMGRMDRIRVQVLIC